MSKRVEAQCQLVAETAAKSAESDTVTQPSGGREGEGQQGSGGDRTEIQESSDLVQLKVALSKQVQRLQELCAHQHEREGGEEEEEEEREAAEGVSLMARKLYDLQRQVVPIVVGFSLKQLLGIVTLRLIGVRFLLLAIVLQSYMPL